jgi:branched-chain amino acid transport system ATP-binding protein
MAEIILKIENFTKAFGGSLVAVDNLSFTQSRGTVKSVIGPNGAGKTTLVNLIMGYFHKREWGGRIYFDGQEISELKKYERASLGITETYQLVKVFKNMSVMENVMVGMHSRTKGNIIENIIRVGKTVREERFIFNEAMKYLKMVNLEERAGDEVESLPYGTQKLVEIARAIASNPKLLIMDEPAAGLNSFEAKELSELIMKIRNNGITVLIIEHNMDLVMNLSDEILVMNLGKKLAEGSPAEIQRNKEVIRAYLGEEIGFA